MFEMRLRCPLESIDIVSDALMEFGALSVSTLDADANTAAEQAIFGEPGQPAPASGWRRNLVQALFDSESDAQQAINLLNSSALVPEAHVQLQSIEPLEDQDWVRTTQAQFSPVPITDEFWIVPSWHEQPAQAKTVIRLDPGVAFGTGTHPTTSMCLRWIATNADWVNGKTVMDYGCGSGILAIAAALHGAALVDAVDIDAAAVEATQYNAEQNNVQIVAKLPTEDDVGAANSARNTAYDLVIANILATPLKVLAPLLTSLLQPNGVLLLSGILERQAEELINAYAPYAKLSIAANMDGWILMRGDRPTS